MEIKLKYYSIDIIPMPELELKSAINKPVKSATCDWEDNHLNNEEKEDVLILEENSGNFTDHFHDFLKQKDYTTVGRFTSDHLQEIYMNQLSVVSKSDNHQERNIKPIRDITERQDEGQMSIITSDIFLKYFERHSQYKGAWSDCGYPSPQLPSF